MEWDGGIWITNIWGQTMWLALRCDGDGVLVITGLWSSSDMNVVIPLVFTIQIGEKLFLGIDINIYFAVN